MAKMEKTLQGSFDEWLSKIDRGIMQGSVSASLEGGSDFVSQDGSSRCSVRVYERFSVIGSNRLSLSVTLFQDAPGRLRLSGIASGGSQAVFLKINTFGEEAFLDELRRIVE